MSLTEKNRVFFLGLGNIVHSYMQYIKSICNFVLNVTYVTLMSGNTSHRCLQLMFMTRFCKLFY